MDQSYSSSDVSLSPSRILERLQVLRQVQLLQRGKLQKQRLQYQDPSETSSSITEIVSHFSNTTSYNTFRSLLHSSQDNSDNSNPGDNSNKLAQHVSDNDLVDGVSVLNISQESEFILNSPASSRSKVSASAKIEKPSSDVSISQIGIQRSDEKKAISLDEMPILSPRKDFEDLILEKLKCEKMKQNIQKGNPTAKVISKRQFLRKGEGMSRFGLKKDALVIQNTKSLPWKQKQMQNKPPLHKDKTISKISAKMQENTAVAILVEPTNKIIKKHEPQKNDPETPEYSQQLDRLKDKKIDETSKQTDSENIKVNPECELHSEKKCIHKEPLKPKHPLISNKGKTWANILTKEQDDFLRQLKQSDYYKNFNSPSKSIVSDASCDETLYKLRQEREKAEQNMFEFLENKVSNESFNLQNSFFNKFLRRSELECSGESTPIVMQKCLQNNPELLHIVSDLNPNKNRSESICDGQTCCSEYTDCSSRDCSSPSTCCSCKDDETLEDTHDSTLKKKSIGSKKVTIKPTDNKKDDCVQTNQSHEDSVTGKEMKANMEEMNAKLAATSELLKERLHELEDEIETFRKENSNLVKMREEFDQEKQKFYEEKTIFEQKFNEEKILSEYYIAEEKEKLTKQKQIYERYVREMRGRLNKKEKDEVVTLKKEISDLKEEIRCKDAKSNSIIARLRNQLKLMDKEKKELSEQVEKLKKENQRIQHSNDVTRRLTNMKYLAEINKKLSQMTSKDNLADVLVDRDIKYKALEIERQSRKRNVLSDNKKIIRPRAKSVPNLNVTSRYAKYFSQRDVISHEVPNDSLRSELGTYTCPSDNDSFDNENHNLNGTLEDAESIKNNDSDGPEITNELEKLYLERFQSNSAASNNSSVTSSNISDRLHGNGDGFFLHKSQSGECSKPIRVSKSPTIKSCKSTMSSYARMSAENDLTRAATNKSKSPISILSNPSQHSIKSNSGTIAPMQTIDRISVSPEPVQKTSYTKTNLNPTEIKKPDGSRELRFPNGNVKYIAADGKYCKFLYYNGDVKENFYSDGRIKYFYAETKTVHTTHPDGLEVLEFPDGQVEKRYKDGSSEVRLPNGSIRYFDPKNEHVREEWRFPDGTTLTVASNGEQRIIFPNGQIEVHAKDHKRREFPDGTVKLVYNDGTAETRYASGRIRIKDKHGNLLMDSATR